MDTIHRDHLPYGKIADLMETSGREVEEMIRLASRSFELMITIWKGFSQRRGSQAAAAISYWSFLSLSSLLVLSAGMAGLLFRGRPEIPAKLLEYVQNRLPALSTVTEEALRTTIDKGGILGIFGLMGLLFTGTRVADSLQTWINLIWGGRQYGWIRTKMKSLAIIAVVGAAVMTGAFAHFLVSSFTFDHPLLSTLFRFLSFLVAIGIQSLGLAFLFVFAPEPWARFREVIPGALFSAVLVNPLQLLLAWYYSRIGDLSTVYGPLAGAILILLSFYYGATIVLLGIELNLAMRSHRKKTLAEFHEAEEL